MFTPLLGVVRADVTRQVGWAKNEIRRQTRHTVTIAVLAILAGLAVLGAVAIGLAALHLWLATQNGPFVAYGVVGGGLLLILLILFALAFARRRPPFASRPALQCARPTAFVGALGHSGYDKVVETSGQALHLTTNTLRDGSRPALFGTLVLVSAVGLLWAGCCGLDGRHTRLDRY
jgi:Zn-dependent protease with chaperone function